MLLSARVTQICINPRVASRLAGVHLHLERSTSQRWLNEPLSPSPKPTGNQKPRLRFPDLANLSISLIEIFIVEVLHHMLHLNLENAARQLT